MMYGPEYLQCVRCGLKAHPRDMLVPPSVCRDIYTCYRMREICRPLHTAGAGPDPDEHLEPARGPGRSGAHPGDAERLPGEPTARERILTRLRAGEKLHSLELMADYGFTQQAVNQFMHRLCRSGQVRRDGYFAPEYRGEARTGRRYRVYAWAGVEE